VSTPDYDRIATATPINREAALARDGRGVHWEPQRRFNLDAVHSDVPLPTLPCPVQPNIPKDMIGKRFGRFVVIGYGGAGASGARWVVRCACGAYEHRRMRALTNPGKPSSLMCNRCDYLEELKAGRAQRP
jgi:hypothetical protein